MYALPFVVNRQIIAVLFTIPIAKSNNSKSLHGGFSHRSQVDAGGEREEGQRARRVGVCFHSKSVLGFPSRMPAFGGSFAGLKLASVVYEEATPAYVSPDSNPSSAVRSSSPTTSPRIPSSPRISHPVVMLPDSTMEQQMKVLLQERMPCALSQGTGQRRPLYITPPTAERGMAVCSPFLFGS